jgi:SNF2 family DNA or RNA helicase
MKPHERRIYDAILARVKSLAEQDFALDYDIMLRLKRGRMMRLRQCISYARLVGAALTDYDERLASGKSSLLSTIRKYDELETPAKLDALAQVVINLRRSHEKVVVWSNFVETLKLIRDRLQRLELGVHLIYGATPTEHSNAREEITREQIIAEFLDPRAGIDVLVANPAACAESISLHKTCSHAVYYDLSYNCAQFLQSTDRIHRVGGSENKTAHYHFLQYADTIDADIATNISTKARNMTAIVDRDYPIYSLDMFSDDEEIEAYDRLFKAERHPIE